MLTAQSGWKTACTATFFWPGGVSLYIFRFTTSHQRLERLSSKVSEINIAISDRAPATYFSGLWEQCKNGTTRYGGITDADQLRDNLAMHCIPPEMETVSAEGYDAFLQERRNLMATKIRDYYRLL